MPPWLIYTLLTMLLWGGWGALSKPLSSAVSSWQMLVVSTLGLLPVIGVLRASRQWGAGGNPRRGFGLAFASGILGSAGNVAYYQALAEGGKAAAVTPLTSLYPLVTIVLALAWLRERLNALQAVGMMFSLAALYCFSGGEGAAMFSVWVLLALVPIGCWGVSALLQKLATAHASSERCTLAFLLGFVPVALAIPLWQPMKWSLPAGTWLLLLALGLLFALGNLTLIFAYGRGGRASVVTPLASLYSLVTIPLAIAFLGEKIAWREGLGIGLALVAVVGLCWEKAPGEAARK
jgi:drug/metabolite transporter (DMT)-like permease